MNLLSPNASALAPDARRTTSAHIPQDEKDEIRRYVSEAGDDDETERRREECAELYGVTVQVIIAIVAWKKIREQRGASGSGRGTAISDGPPLEEGSVGFSDAAPLDPPRAAALRTDTAAKVDDIAQLDSSVREDIVAQMRDALGDPDELPYVDDNIAALAQRYGVSAWTIELLSGRNIPRARQIIESVRANVRSALAFEGIAQIAQTRGTAPSSPAIDHAGAAPIGTTVSTPSEGLRNVDDDAKSHIRAYVAAGENTDEKKRRRREMAERYGLTIYQVAAITAWTIIDEKRAAAAGTISKNDSIPVSALPDAAVTTVPTGTDPADSAPREIGQASDVAEDSEFDEGPLLDLAA